MQLYGNFDGFQVNSAWSVGLVKKNDDNGDAYLAAYHGNHTWPNDQFTIGWICCIHFRHTFPEKKIWEFWGLDLSGAAQQVRNPPALGELIGLSVYW